MDVDEKVDEIIRKVLEVVDQEGTKINERVARALKKGTMDCKSIKDKYLQKGDVKKAMIVYKNIAEMYNQIADKIQDKKHREILRMMADFWTQSREIESKLSAELSFPSEKPSKKSSVKSKPKLIDYEPIGPTHREVLPKITEIPKVKVYQKKFMETKAKAKEAEVRGYIEEIERKTVQLRGLVKDVTPIYEMEYLSKKRPEEMVKELSDHDIIRTYV